MEFSMFCVQVFSEEDIKVREDIITLVNIQQPSVGEFFATVLELYPDVMPEDFGTYWRYSPSLFVPVYDYSSYRTALCMMAEKKFYVVQNRTGKAWDIHEHPFYTHMARSYDVTLLTLMSPPREIAEDNLGYTKDRATAAAYVFNMLKDAPTPSKDAPSKAESEEKKKSQQKKKQQKNKTTFYFLCLREKPVGAMLPSRQQQHQPMSSEDMLNSALDDSDFEDVSADVEELYLHCTSNTVYVLDTSHSCGEMEDLVKLFGSPAGKALMNNNENPSPSCSSSRTGSPDKRNGCLSRDSRQKHRRKSSLDLYKEAAALLGLTCTMTDNCRCLDCQSRYFEYEEEDRLGDTGLAAGTPALLDHVLTHPMTCTLQ